MLYFSPYAWVMPVMSIMIGLIIGSFLNVVVARLPHGQSIVLPRSFCPSCRKTIHWKQNIPILSYLFLKGKCHQCRASISFRYPMIEFITAILFLAAGMKNEWPILQLVLRDWPFLAILVAITFIDLEHRVIPDPLSLGGLVLGLATFGLTADMSLLDSFLGAAIGFGFFYSLSWLYYKFRGRLGLGGGDVKLLAMLGAFIGPMGVMVTICISSLFGSLVGLVWAGFSRKNNLMQFAIPYGPFLVVGALFYYFLGDFIWFLYMKQI